MKHVLPPGLIAGKRVLVAGSSWPDDEDQLLPAFYRLCEEHKDLLLILVPHEPTLEHLERAEFTLNGRCSSIRFSNVSDYAGEKVIIIDSIGILMSLYQYAHVVYVGGSFKQGIHNVLEPAVYGVPIVIGPRHQNSQEAGMLVSQGGAFVGVNSEGLHDAFHRLLSNEPGRQAAGGICLNFVRDNVGATERFLSYLEKVL
jgi:3-deoxy-D-manno-octulosonic-acid transferase